MPDPPTQSPGFPRLLGSYDGDTPGPLVIGIGGMHGNEPAGVFALQDVLHGLHTRRPSFRGKLLALTGNRAALAHGCRYIDEDFNRLWVSERLQEAEERCAEPTSEEQERRELLAAIEAALAQRQGPAVFLDLHTTSAEGQPFVVIGDSLPNRRFAFGLQAPVILGLEEQLEGTLLNHLSEQGHIVIGFEGGQHASPGAVQNHIAAIWSVLTTAGCLRPQDVPPGKPSRRKTPTEQPVLEICYHHLIQAGDDFVMEPGFTNFQPVKRGQLLARDRHGQIRASESGQILMPLYQGQGADGFFLVRTVRRFWLRLAVWLRYLRLERLLPLLPGVRRHPDQAATLIVEPRIARWFVMEIFHLLGFRKKRYHSGKLLVSRRWHEPGVFEAEEHNQ